MKPRRVAITGIGMVTALGLTREENWTNLLNGTCGMGDVTVFPTEGFRSRIAAEVPYDRLKARSGAGGPGAINSGLSPPWKRPTTAV